MQYLTLILIVFALCLVGEEPMPHPLGGGGELEALIVATESNLAAFTQLRETVDSYRVLRQQYEEHSNDRELGYQLVMEAQKILYQIETLHLAHAFDQEFLSEIAFFTRIAEKWNAPSSS